MIRSLIQNIIVLFCFIPLCNLTGQNDSIALRMAHKVPVSTSDTVTQTVDFNALHFTQQNRYRDPGVPFINKKFSDNLSISVFGGIEKLLQWGNSTLQRGADFGLAAGKPFNPDNSIRLSFTGGWFPVASPVGNRKLLSFGIQADHIFNISSFLNGYNPGRLFEVSTVEGIGYHLVMADGERNQVGDIHLGLQFKINTTRNIDLFIEPRVTLYTDNVDRSLKTNWHRYDFGYGATAGFTYRFNPTLRQGDGALENSSFWNNTFYGFNVGGQMQNSGLVDQIGWMESVRPHFSLTFGKWLNPLLGFRLSGFTSYNVWNVEDDMQKVTVFGGGRLEAMVNFMSFAGHYNRQGQFGLTAIIGPELARMYKQNFDTPVKSIYVGMTGGLQFKYFVADNIAVSIEPRMSHIPYSITKTDEYTGRTERQEYSDNVYSMNIGFEFHRADRKQRNECQLSEKTFTPAFFVSANAGFCMPLKFNKIASHKYPGYQFSINVGRHFTPLSTLRLNGDIEKYRYIVKLKNVPVHDQARTMTVSVDYLFNLSNFIAGYVPDRPVDLYLLIGPTLSFNRTYTLFGGETGVQASYDINSRFSIYLEPKLRFYNEKLITGLSTRGSNLFISFVAGTVYKF